MDYRNRVGRARSGSLIVEAAISAALLATATVAMTKLARSAATLSQQSDQRLAATLAAENTLERLRNVPTDDLSDQAGRVAAAVSQITRCDVTVQTDAFVSDDIRGVHLRVAATAASNVQVTLHDWHFNSQHQRDSAEKSETETSDSNAERGDDE